MILTCTNCGRNIADIDFGFYVQNPVIGTDGHTLKYALTFMADIAGDTVRYNSLNGLLSCRKRLDGYWGYECDCGFDSRISAQEAGIILPNVQPTIADFQQVLAAVADAPTDPVLENFQVKQEDGTPVTIGEQPEAMSLEQFTL